ncbi:MAG: cation-transporting P-type ATPase [Pseudomonadota bacterium]|uniref:cation-transporting P-type ATPase n=1 Tax=Piscinibacter defluvii TaxID=1796922 RepID=UPI001F0C6958|nr:cation-transporting P-type ATPase [Piscinibacter defluvii]
MIDAATPVPQLSEGPSAGRSGLSSAEAAARLVRTGLNRSEAREVPTWRRLASRLWAPVPWMLEAVIVLQLALGRQIEAAVITALLVFNALAAQWQERRARDALALLRQRLQVTARVLRDDRSWCLRRTWCPGTCCTCAQATSSPPIWNFSKAACRWTSRR